MRVDTPMHPAGSRIAAGVGLAVAILVCLALGTAALLLLVNGVTWVAAVAAIALANVAGIFAAVFADELLARPALPAVEELELAA